MRKVFVLLTVIFAMAASPVQCVQAYESTAVVQMKKENTVEPKADVIVEKFRTYNGVLQYRRWNKTRSCWVDPDWIDLT